MRVRGRAGRARFVTSSRATARELPTDEYLEPPVQLSRKIDKPEDLVKIVEATGARVRRTKSSGWRIAGPDGTTTIPRTWSYGNGREHVLSQVRRTGIDLAGAEAEPDRAETEPATEDVPGKLVVPDRPRPTLAYSAPNTRPAAQEIPVPSPADMPTQRANRTTEVTAADLDTLLEHVSKLESDLAEARAAGAALGRRVEVLERAQGAPSVYDKSRDIRERIMGWFEQFPPGMKLSAGVVTSNLCPDGEDSEAYRRQLPRLAEAGRLEQHGQGRATTYSRPAPTGDDQ